MAKPQKPLPEQQTIALMAATIFGGVSKGGERVTSREAVEAALKIWEHVDQALHFPEKYEMNISSKEVERYIKRAKQVALTPTEQEAVQLAEKINEQANALERELATTAKMLKARKQ